MENGLSKMLASAVKISTRSFLAFMLAAVLTVAGFAGSFSGMAKAQPAEALDASPGEALDARSGETLDARHGEALEVRPGDVVFQELRTPQSLALMKATRSDWTHCGIVAERDGKLVVQEALMRMVETPLSVWISRGGGKIVVMRLQGADEVLTPEALAALDEEFQKLRDKRYDFWFQWSDDKIYCSELVHKMYDRALGIELAPLKKLGDYDFSDPAVQKLAKKRFPQGLDLEEPVVAPVDLLESPIFVRVN